MAVVTSCSASGWKEYGRRFFDSFLEYWPKAIPLYVVSEDDLQLPDGERHVFLRLEHEFLERHKDNLRAQGRVQMPGDVRWKANSPDYNFRYDAFRFSKKVFAIQMASRRPKHGVLFWVDADVVTHAAVPMEFLDWIMPRDKAIACLDRGETYHSECGFVGYNLDHDLGPQFIDEFANLYASDEVFRLQEWHDSWVFDWLRRRLGTPTSRIAHCSRHQPFINSKLGRYMDHLKGSTKKLGRSPERFLETNRDVPYFRRRLEPSR